VSAAFTLLPPVRLAGLTSASFTAIGETYAAAQDGATIQAKAVGFTENLLFDRGIAVTLSGGYDGAYGFSSGYTTVSGDMTITGGTVVVENLVLQ